MMASENGLPSHARAVVIGCGIVGNSLAYHLTRLGWRDIVLLDKGPLPNPGGSTGHASNFIYLVDHSKEMTALTTESVRQYREMGVFIQSGGIEVARTKERMQELTRRIASAGSWGIEGTSLLTPGDVKEFVPYIDESVILGGFHTIGVGVVDSLRAGTLMRERAVAAGALHVAPKTEVVGIDVEGGRVRRVRTTQGDIEAEVVAITCGVWSPRLSRTEFPFTQADFEQQMQHAMELMPEIVGDESVGVKYAINGILSLTPDGMPVLGESPDVGGLWTAAAVWVKEGPGTGKAMAEWMVHGESEIDLHSSDIARFHEHQKTRAHVRARAAEGFNKTYGIVHPSEQWASNRNVRLAPFHTREVELGAFFFEAAGWERPQWYESNAPLLQEFGDRVTRRTAEWESRWWSPLINAEHLAMRERAGLFDLSAFTIFDIVGPGALASVQRTSLRQMDVPAGRVVYTPVLSPEGGLRSDLTIMRLGNEQFRVVTGGASGMSDKKWFRDQLVAGAELADLTSSMTTIGLS